MFSILTLNPVQLAIIIHTIDAGYISRINVIRNTFVEMLNVRIVVAKCVPIIAVAVPNHSQSRVFYTKYVGIIGF